MQNFSNTRFLNVQALRGIAVLAVVMFHLTSIESKYGGGGVILPAWLDFGQFGVDLFFVISGFVMMVVTSNRSGRMEANRFLYHRVTRIYPLYWFYSALLLAVLFVKPSWVIGSHDRIIDIPASFLLLPQDTYPLLSVGWTLIHEMYFYLMFFAVVRLAPAGNRMQLLTAWLLAVVILNLLSLSGSATYSLTTNPMTLEFLCGCLIAQYGSVMKDALKYSLPIVAVLSAMLAIIAFLSYRDATGIVGPTGWWRILIFGLPAGMIVLSAVRAEQSGMLMWPFLRRIGDASYSIYLSHILVLALLGKIWGQFALQGVSDNLVVLPVMLLLTLAAGDLSFRYIEQPMLRVCRKWY